MRKSASTISESNCRPAPALSAILASPVFMPSCPGHSRDHGGIGIRHRQDARQIGRSLALEPVRITAAVKALMVMAHDGREVLERRHLLEPVGRHRRVPPHLRPLLLGQRRGLVEDGIGNHRHADVVQPARLAQHHGVRRRQFQRLCEPARGLLDGARVPAEECRLRRDRRHHRLDVIEALVEQGHDARGVLLDPRLQHLAVKHHAVAARLLGDVQRLVGALHDPPAGCRRSSDSTTRRC